ncbi:hypothetical protein XI09_07085 [Bradyrhizobium sp. CCBAU 11386]|nr:hypothetical protein [Bradyrhizobium sp. CCBAU 11386]
MRAGVTPRMMMRRSSSCRGGSIDPSVLPTRSGESLSALPAEDENRSGLASASAMSRYRLTNQRLVFGQ